MEQVDEDRLVEEEPPISIEKYLESFAPALRIFEKFNDFCSDSRLVFANYCRALRLDDVTSMKQTTINEHFRKK